MTITERLAALRRLMKERGVDAYYIPSDDFHGSEYVGEHFKCRKFMSGFTGSAGTLVVMAGRADLWTDGRYFLQAEQQLEGTGITLEKMGEEGVPTVLEYLKAHLAAGQVLGFDGRTVTTVSGGDFERELPGVQIACDMDLVGEVWTDRPAISSEPIWEMDAALTGYTRAQKIADIRSDMAAKGADTLVIASLDDIAWLLNIRGDDVACNPVVMAYLMMTADQVTAYVQTRALPDAVRAALEADGVTVREYEDIYRDVTGISAGSCVWIDPSSVNYKLRSLLPDGVQIVEADNPTIIRKAIKTPEEVGNMRRSHIRDGVAVCRFIYWLKTHVGKETITELSAAEKLEEFRGMGEGYLGPSFESIVGYADHGAIIHYEPTPETDVELKPEHMLLVDSGGQYHDGTTDITRTIVLGPVTEREKEFFTRVLIGHLNLGSAQFREGCSGLNLDYLAREPLWEIGEDFNHGTGHGVGFVLNVHEGPNSFHWRSMPRRKANTPFAEGMITSDEPGYYPEGEFGIRHENLMVCVKGEKRPSGQFMHFEFLTMVPFDREAIVPEMMTKRELKALNDYHQLVRENIAPLLEGEEREWLIAATEPIEAE